MRRTSLVSFLLILSACAAFAQKSTFYLMAFDVKGPVRSVVTNSNGIKTTAQFNTAGELTRYADQYGDIPYHCDMLSFYIDGRDPDSQTFFFDSQKQRINIVNGTTGQYGYKDKYVYAPDGTLLHIKRTIMEGFEETETKVIPVKVIARDSKGNWTTRMVGDETITRSIMYYSSDGQNASSNKYASWYNRLNKRYKVKGGAGIEQFVSAIGVYDPDGNARYILDKKNGFFAVNQEGAGHLICNAAYWNRKDGKKLFIVAFDFSELAVDGADMATYGNTWSYTMACDVEGGRYNMRYEIGFKAYLYDPATSELVPLKQVPFNGWPTKPYFRYLILPQQGKDIKVREGSEWDRYVEHTLKWNGMTFDYK